MIHTRDDLRPNPMYPVYPPYHKGDYLEDYFYNKFAKETPAVSREYIAISWTTLYCHNDRSRIQKFLDDLPRDKKYFTVSQHDDAPYERLPPDTICFSAGGNVKGNNIIPIPLVCSPIEREYQEEERPILASFVGSMTHPIRAKMFEACRNEEGILMRIKGWTPKVDDDEFSFFFDVTTHSKFCLCPRGYGLNSFRLYESMQLGAIPVIITDDLYLPWSDELNWSDFSVLISENDIKNIVSILKERESEMPIIKDKIQQIYKKYFTMNGFYDRIVERLK
jgi:hypothetical protein